VPPARANADGRGGEANHAAAAGDGGAPPLLHPRVCLYIVPTHQLLLADVLTRYTHVAARALYEPQARRVKVDADVAHVESEEAAQRALRAKYWHEFNEFNFQLQAHMEERDAVLARIESTCEARERLRHTNVYNDAFHIWHHGPFGTINNFRLGRLPNAPVRRPPALPL
jgi:hypothetical protein